MVVSLCHPNLHMNGTPPLTSHSYKISSVKGAPLKRTTRFCIADSVRRKANQRPPKHYHQLRSCITQRLGAIYTIKYVDGVCSITAPFIFLIVRTRLDQLVPPTRSDGTFDCEFNYLEDFADICLVQLKREAFCIKG